MLLSIIRDSFNKIQAGRNRIFIAQSLLKAIALIVFSIELLSTGTIGVFSYSVGQKASFFNHSNNGIVLTYTLHHPNVFFSETL